MEYLGITIEHWAKKHDGKYPDSLDELVKTGNIKYLPSCSLTNKEYKYEKTIDGFIISCPNPKKHIGLSDSKSRTKKLYYQSGKGLIHE